MGIKAFDEFKNGIGESFSAWVQLVGHIRVNYTMDELWDDKDELKFRKSGKTLATLYVHDGYFTFLLIFGKNERPLFEDRQNEFSNYIIDYYNNSKTYHDGKWMFIDVRDSQHVDELIKMLHIKKKPNRKAENLTNALLGKCGSRCDLCLLHKDKNITEKGHLIFKEGSCKCYDYPVDGDDYPTCEGCHDNCKVVKCVASKEYTSCIDCDYDNCTCDTHNFTDPGRCSLGLSNEDLELFVLPYCGKERFDRIKSSKSAK